MELSSKVSLTEINVSANLITGTIPSWIGNLTNLQTLSLASNQLVGPIRIDRESDESEGALSSSESFLGNASHRDDQPVAAGAAGSE
ncbi:MAG: hypothetical protein MZV49_12990 [Rhodopseudomonas palustris]|nr:hypothetical protein [Rhodopseudomonas palustris]